MSKWTIKKWGLAVACGFGLLFAYKAREILAQIASTGALSVAFAVILSPVCKKLEIRGLSSSAAAGISLAGLLSVLLLALGGFLPYLVSHSVDLITRITPTITGTFLRIREGLELGGLPLKAGNGVPDWLFAGIAAVSAQVARAGFSVVRQTGMIVLSLVIAFYFLKERKLLYGYMLLLLPVTKRTPVCAALFSCKNAILGYLSGVVKTSLFVSLSMLIGLSILGIQDALLLALFTGLFEVFPYIGPVLAAVPVILVALPQGIPCVLACIILIVVVQQLEGNVVSPLLTASSTSVHPLASIIGVYVGGSLWGLWGILLAVPMIVTAQSVVWSLRMTREG